jgi:hypothetical protein
VHRTAGKFKTPLKTSKSFPALTKITRGHESIEDVNVQYQQKESEPSQPRKVETSNKQQPEKGDSPSIFDETDFDIDVFQLVDEGKWMIQGNLQLREQDGVAQKELAALASPTARRKHLNVFPSPHDKQLPLKVSENFLISAYIARLAYVDFMVWI